MRRLLCMFCLFCLLGGLAAARDSTGLRLVCDDWAPYEMQDDQGNITGLSHDIVLAVLKRMQIPLAAPVEMLPWKRALALVEAGKADGAFSGVRSREREVFAYFSSEPLVQAPWVVFVRKDDLPQFNQLADLRSRKAGIVNGWSYPDKLRLLFKQGAVSVTSLDPPSNFRNLALGRVDYIVDERRSGLHIMAQNNLQDRLAIANLPAMRDDGLYLLLSKASVSAELAERFDRELKAFKASPEYRTLQSRYGIHE
ncbi:substrate-binding periplasmic protein [Parachitinimonas caeni]|uniref:Transporter substrate-binding domain-containing protein n=1 Tax=Parachitinimonas caeni TaxID=3031301 RepID=A0ABT7E4C5_9NEIS|nr:transporter substrate-binding domain-containing protein [Parachitinimonas caeni]MDK2126280.1 transporter substrate-binding domain-containing protein [Parachitinimonas caeni]